MELLIKRDKTFLKRVEGESFVNSDLPEFLKTPRVVPSYLVTKIHERDKNDDLLLRHYLDGDEIRNLFYPEFKVYRYMKKLDVIPALWSGHRSVLVNDPRRIFSGRGLYRLKGVSLDLKEPQLFSGEGYKEIRGGQKFTNAVYEAEMTHRFNKVLESVGIEPLMKTVGIWKYPLTIKGLRPVTTLFEVKGDTRLDELVRVIDGLYISRVHKIRDPKKKNLVHIGQWTHLGEVFYHAVKDLMKNVGYTTGRLKRLMDKSGQTWSSEDEQTNAHIGNIVLYNGTDKLKVGLVDFDSSESVDKLSKSQIEALQKREYKDLISSSTRIISPREMTGKPFLEDHIRSPWMTQLFVEGFKNGYSAEPKGPYSNEIDLSVLNVLFDTFRAEGDFSQPTLKQLLEPYRVKKKESEGIDLDAIFERHLETGRTQVYHDKKTGSSVYVGAMKSKPSPQIKITQKQLDSIHKAMGIPKYEDLDPA